MVYNIVMNKILLSYLAGVMDSDGYFTIKRNTYNIRVTKTSHNPAYYERVGIKQVQPQAVTLIYKYFGGYFHKEKPNTKNGKMLWSIQLTNLKANKFIKSIYPFLKIKKEQAHILIKLRKSLNQGKKNKGKKIYQKSRWGSMMFSRRAITSKSQTKYREFLINKIKTLNDSRNDITHQPLPWENL